ncbi:MAG TPA: glycosyltransferase [Syntrophomonadaceae bacterium]|nr:glycosyltransferase [Syntrophomonadaceae bacterium]
MQTILYLPCFDFFGHRQRPQHLLWEISKLGFKVIYCNVTKQSPEFIPLSSTFVLCNNVAALDYQREYIMWLTHGPYVNLLSKFRLNLVVSDFADASVDEFAEFAAYDKNKAQAANVILAASEVIYQSLSQSYPHCYLVPNGVDPLHFKKATETRCAVPRGMERVGLNKPIIGFWGALSPWLDLPLLLNLAELRPGYNFVLIGGCNMDSALLPRRDNIHYLGPLDYEILPQYAFHFGAAIIPFQVKPVTLAADPIKAYEYLACGLPVVSTNLPRLQGAADTRLSRTPREFAQHLDWAVRQGKTKESVQARLAFAGSNTWESRARSVAGILAAAEAGGYK